MVHNHHISLYDEDSVLILVMATDVPGVRTVISGTCLLILPNSVPGCFRDWYMLAHPALLFFRLHPAGPPQCGTFVAPERHARSSTNDFILSGVFSPFPTSSLFQGGGRHPRRPARLSRPRERLPRARRKPRPRRGAASASWRCRRQAPGWGRFRRRRLHRRRRRCHLHRRWRRWRSCS